MTKLVYLAAPYSHPDATVRNDRVEAASYFAAKLMTDFRAAVFSPITHGHAIAEHLPPFTSGSAEHEFWMRQCFPMLRRVEELVALPIPGWRESKGVQMEMAFAKEFYIPICIVASREFDCEHIQYEELRANGWGEVCL